VRQGLFMFPPSPYQQSSPGTRTDVLLESACEAVDVDVDISESTPGVGSCLDDLLPLTSGV
jgi:hypothetical protein